MDNSRFNTMNKQKKIFVNKILKLIYFKGKMFILKQKNITTNYYYYY